MSARLGAAVTLALVEGAIVTFGGEVIIVTFIAREGEEVVFPDGLLGIAVILGESEGAIVVFDVMSIVPLVGSDGAPV